MSASNVINMRNWARNCTLPLTPLIKFDFNSQKKIGVGCVLLMVVSWAIFNLFGARFFGILHFTFSLFFIEMFQIFCTQPVGTPENCRLMDCVRWVYILSVGRILGCRSVSCLSVRCHEESSLGDFEFLYKFVDSNNCMSTSLHFASCVELSKFNLALFQMLDIGTLSLWVGVVSKWVIVYLWSSLTQ